jgi:hypothetical protein
MNPLQSALRIAPQTWRGSLIDLRGTDASANLMDASMSEIDPSGAFAKQESMETFVRPGRSQNATARAQLDGLGDHFAVHPKPLQLARVKKDRTIYDLQAG